MEREPIDNTAEWHDDGTLRVSRVKKKLHIDAMNSNVVRHLAIRRPSRTNPELNSVIIGPQFVFVWDPIIDLAYDDELWVDGNLFMRFGDGHLTPLAMPMDGDKLLDESAAQGGYFGIDGALSALVDGIQKAAEGEPAAHACRYSMGVCVECGKAAMV